MHWVVMFNHRSGCTKQICAYAYEAVKRWCLVYCQQPPFSVADCPCLHPCSDVSRNSEISLQCYLRSGESLNGNANGGPGAGRDGQGDDVMGVGDIYLGGVKFVPSFENQVGGGGASEAVFLLFAKKWGVLTP